MSVYISIPLLILLSVLQVSFMPSFAIFQIKPDLVLIAIACWGVIGGPRQALFWAIPGGLFCDLLGNTPVGTSILALSVVAGMTSVSESAWVDRNLLLALMLTFLGTIAYSVCFLIVLEMAGRHTQWTAILQTVVLPSAIFNTVLVPAGYWLLARLHKRARGAQEFEW